MSAVGLLSQANPTRREIKPGPAGATPSKKGSTTKPLNTNSALARVQQPNTIIPDQEAEIAHMLSKPGLAEQLRRYSILKSLLKPDTTDEEVLEMYERILRRMIAGGQVFDHARQERKSDLLEQIAQLAEKRRKEFETCIDLSPGEQMDRARALIRFTKLAEMIEFSLATMPVDQDRNSILEQIKTRLEALDVHKLNLILACSPGVGKGNETSFKLRGIPEFRESARIFFEQLEREADYNYAYLPGRPIVARTYKANSLSSLSMNKALKALESSGFLTGERENLLEHVHSIIEHKTNADYVGIAQRYYMPIGLVIENMLEVFLAEVLAHEAQHEADYNHPVIHDIYTKQYNRLPDQLTVKHDWFFKRERAAGFFASLILELRAYHTGLEFLLHQLKNKAINATRSTRELVKARIADNIQRSKSARAVIDEHRSKFTDIPGCDDLIDEIHAKWDSLERRFHDFYRAG